MVLQSLSFLESIVLPLLVACHASFSAICKTIMMWTLGSWSIPTEFMITIITFSLSIHRSIWVDTIIGQLLSTLCFLFNNFLRFSGYLLLDGQSDIFCFLRLCLRNFNFLSDRFRTQFQFLLNISLFNNILIF